MTQVSTLASFVWFAIMIAGAISGMVGLHNGSYLYKVSEDKKVFRKPLALRVGTALFGVAMCEAPFMFADGGWTGIILFLVPCLVLGGVFLWLSGPNELQLNQVKRTYQRISGWPIFSTARSGSWTDMWGVYVGVVGSTSGSTYFVGIRGNQFGGRMDLGRFSAQAIAQQFANELAYDLDLPHVSPPRPLVPTKQIVLS